VQVYRGLPETALGPSAVTIGSFDGIHRGHQAVIARTMEEAAAEDLLPTLLTFEPHPRCVLDPPNCPRSLTTLDEKLELLERCGLAATVVYPFEPETRLVAAADFMRSLDEHLQLRVLVAGPDFALGRRREGDVGWLRRDGAERGYRLEVMEPVSEGGEEVRSSGLRALLAAGSVQRAAELLGRLYSLRGPVERGERVGRELGWPTVNLAVPAPKLVPRQAIYAGWAKGDFGRRMAAINVGYRLTFGGSRLTIEAHLLEFEGDLYEQEVTLEFASRLRDEVRFADPSELARQIGADVDETRRRLSA
jgi:riboflavin kinase/FMN adenylyltransferase